MRQPPDSAPPVNEAKMSTTPATMSMKPTITVVIRVALTAFMSARTPRIATTTPAPKIQAQRR
jgi:hypothetical protein